MEERKGWTMERREMERKLQSVTLGQGERDIPPGTVERHLNYHAESELVCDYKISKVTREGYLVNLKVLCPGLQPGWRLRLTLPQGDRFRCVVDDTSEVEEATKENLHLSGLTEGVAVAAISVSRGELNQLVEPKLPSAGWLMSEPQLHTDIQRKYPLAFHGFRAFDEHEHATRQHNWEEGGGVDADRGKNPLSRKIRPRPSTKEEDHRDDESATPSPGSHYRNARDRDPKRQQMMEERKRKQDRIQLKAEREALDRELAEAQRREREAVEHHESALDDHEEARVRFDNVRFREEG